MKFDLRLLLPVIFCGCVVGSGEEEESFDTTTGFATTGLRPVAEGEAWSDDGRHGAGVVGGN